MLCELVHFVLDRLQIHATIRSLRRMFVGLHFVDNTAIFTQPFEKTAEFLPFQRICLTNRTSALDIESLWTIFRLTDRD